jgi:alpha-tubulin suppressor-like RCC1 family protein
VSTILTWIGKSFLVVAVIAVEAVGVEDVDVVVGVAVCAMAATGNKQASVTAAAIEVVRCVIRLSKEVKQGRYQSKTKVEQMRKPILGGKYGLYHDYMGMNN